MRDRCYPIGVLSARTGVNIETIRYYERIGIMPAPPRTEGRQRVYGEDHLKRLTFIRRGRELGFSLDEIRDLLGLVRGHGLTCAEVKAMTVGHVADIRRKVMDLKRLERGSSAARARLGRPRRAMPRERGAGVSDPRCPVGHSRPDSIARHGQWRGRQTPASVVPR